MANVIEQIVSPASYGGQIIEMNVRSNERGPQGEKGDQGDPASVNAGQAYTIDYGQQPQVMNTGTPENAVLDFYIPEGKPGAIHYTAGPGINITEDNRIEATGEVAVYWGDLVGNINNQTDLKNALNAKQNVLTAGANVQINADTISATDTTYTAGTNVSISSSNVISATDTTYNDFVGATGVDAGVAGLVPAPASSDNANVLKGNGTWGQVATQSIADSAVTTNKINAGAVTVAKLDKSGLLDLFYPVGSYYETSDTTFDPNVSWGGTWAEDTNGLATVAYDSAQTEFDTVGETGGEKTHTLVINEMPSHTHDQYVTANSGPNPRSSYTGDGQFAAYYQCQTGYKGGDQPHNNLQPYIVVKRWHRTA